MFLKIQTCKSNLVKRIFSKGTNVHVHSFATFRIFCIFLTCELTIALHLHMQNLIKAMVHQVGAIYGI